MNRLALAALTFAFMSLSYAAEPVSAGQVPCDAPPMPGDSREIKCTVPAGSTARQYRFVVHFVGGHDDTSASFKAFEDGQPLACDKASKLSLFGEDGEVSLYCNFSPKQDAASPHVVSFSVLWSHAQYDRFELVEQ